jgi:ribokinase
LPRRLVVVAGVLVDIVLYITELPRRGGDVAATKWLMTTGGGYNVMTAASRMGMSVAFGGHVGTGQFGRQVQSDLEAAGIPLMLPPVAGQDSGFDVGMIESSGERTFVTVPGVEARPSLVGLTSLPLLDGDVVYVPGDYLIEDHVGDELAEWAATLPEELLLALDPGPRVADIPRPRLDRVLARTDFLSANGEEAEALVEGGDLAAMVDRLAARLAPGATVVVRCGAFGCWTRTSAGGVLHIQPRPAHVVDTNGAGDVHTGVLLACLARGESVPAAAWSANVAASLSTELFGPAACPTEKVVLEAMAREGLG